MDEDLKEALEFQEIEFYGFIRKHLICLLLFVFLYLISFSIIKFVKTRSENDEFYAGDEDFFVYRVAVWMCSCALAVAIGAVTLLPFSVLGSEVLYIYPNNFYFKWLNVSLIHSMWNYVFFLSNISMFVLLPFAYFFIESQGFNLQRLNPRPLLSRVYETLVVCILLMVMLVTTTDVFYSLVLAENASISFSLFYFTNLSTPLIYSFVSLSGVFLLLISTPFGFARMFDIFSGSLNASSSKSTNIRRISSSKATKRSFSELNKITTPERLQAISCLRKQRSTNPIPNQNTFRQRYESYRTFNYLKKFRDPPLKNTTPKIIATVAVDFLKNRRHRLKNYLDGALPFWNSVKYPIFMLLLLILMMLSLSMVLINMLQLLFGLRALPEYVQSVELHSNHTFGIVGALFENTIILYIMLASLVGIYSVPLLRRIRPQRGKTTLTCIIMNCAVILLLSSALPVLARTLGITSFDLLGAYGRLNWISNFSLVWSYNLVFAVLTIICLVNKLTLPVRRELMRRLCSITHSSSPQSSNSSTKAEKLN